jgi:hypothetical protein
MNKTEAIHILTFEYRTPAQFLPVLEESISTLLLFDAVSTTIIPGKTSLK